MLSEFDYFTPTILQSSIIHEYDEPIAPVNSTGIVGNTIGTLEFNIAPATDLYRDLNNTVLELKIKVVAKLVQTLALTIQLRRRISCCIRSLIT